MNEGRKSHDSNPRDMTCCSKDHPLLAIVGPTATGKSSLAVKLAQRIDGEIINCDSMQMIKGMKVGTAKPDAVEMNRVPHHLYDRLDPAEDFSAGDFMREARALCRQIAARNKVPLLVGGTGLYLRAFRTGLFKGPSRSPELRQRLERKAERLGTEYLFRMLERKDPVAARRLAPSDRPRLIRALEVFFLTREPISELQKRTRPLKGFTFRILGLKLPRERLYNRINRRVEVMFREGLLEEVSDLLKHGYTCEDRGFEALGYRYAAAVVRNEMELQRAIELTQRDSRRYAKRQLTWFRKEKEICWIEFPGEDPRALSQALSYWTREFTTSTGSI